MKPIVHLAVVLPLLSLIGCASAGQQDLETAKDRIRTLQKESAASQARIDDLEQRVDALEGSRASASPSAPTPGAAPPATPEPVGAVGPVTRIEIEESDLDALPAPTGEMPSPPASTESGRVANQPVSPEGQALYDRGYTFYHESRYLDAEATFQQFLQAHGHTDLADNAQYWIGECRWGRKDYQGAMDAFRETVERYPEGNKVPDALLKVGQSLEQVGDTEGAKLTYEEVARRYPTSRASAVATDRRADLP